MQIEEKFVLFGYQGVVCDFFEKFIVGGIWGFRLGYSGRGRRVVLVFMDVFRGNLGCWQGGEGVEVGERERELMFIGIG